MSQVSKPTSILDIEVQCKDFMRWLEIEEHEGYAVLKQREYIDRKTWLKIYGLVKDMGGRYLAGLSAFEVPFAKKPTIKETPSSPKKPINEAYEERERLFSPQGISKEVEQNSYNLQESYAKLGGLAPVIYDAHGNVIDGKHRLSIDPNWRRMTLMHIKDPVQLAIARLTINVCRRRVPAEEKRELLSEIAKLTGWAPQQIAENIGMSYTWVMKYLPSEYKDKTMAEIGAKGGEISATHRVAIPQEDHLKQIDKEAIDGEENFESQNLTTPIPIEHKDTGVLVECPICNGKYHLIHVNPTGKHYFKEEKRF